MATLLRPLALAWRAFVLFPQGVSLRWRVVPVVSVACDEPSEDLVQSEAEADGGSFKSAWYDKDPDGVGVSAVVGLLEDAAGCEIRCEGDRRYDQPK